MSEQTMRVPPSVPTSPCHPPPSCSWDNGNGYYRMHADGQRVYVHRYFYEMANGPIPEGLTLDHLCRQTWCCNPGHLEPVTVVVNTMRGTSPPAENARKADCPVCGMAYAQSPNGRRRCEPCRLAHRIAVGETPGTGRSADHNAAKTHCLSGHPYDEQNTYYTHTAGRTASRQCRACNRERARARREAARK